MSIFAVYASGDEDLFKELRSHLSPLRRQGKIDLRQEPAGDVAMEELAKCDVLLLLISRHLIEDDARYDLVEEAMRLRDQQGKRVIPVLVRPAVVDGFSFKKLAALPRNGRPVSEWGQRDAAWVEVVQGIRDVLVKQEQPLPAPAESEQRIHPGVPTAESIKKTM